MKCGTNSMNTCMKVMAIAVSALCMAGCILPIPHIRQHIYATQGIVVDSDTGKPVAGAKVEIGAGRYMQETITDSSGHFAIEDERGWHMILWLAPPSSGALLPTHVDYADGFFHMVVISAHGYPRQAFHLCVPETNFIYTYPLKKHQTKGRVWMKDECQFREPLSLFVPAETNKVDGCSGRREKALDRQQD